MRIGTPVNQVRLTNVAYVRLNKNGKRFEIAAYRNKVLSYRNKVETDLSQVLQIDTVFTNVTKGLLANSKDLIEAFGTSDQILVCKEILDKGELQVSEQERVALLDSTFRDVASIVADKAINPENNRPYTVSMIQNAMRQIHYSVNVSKSSKSQALDVIRKLKAIMPIARASMLLRVVCPSKYFESMKDILLKEFNVSIITQGIQGQSNAAAATATTDTTDANTNVKENDSSSNNVFMEFKFDTELFRKLEETVQQHTRNEGILEVLQLRTSSGPTDSTTSNTTTTTDDNPIDTELPQPQIEKKAKDIISKSELKKIEKNNDFKVNANSDDDNDDEEETVFGIVKKNKKIKKNKNKNDIDKNDTVEHNHRDNEDDDGDDDDDKDDGKGTQKKSKKAKRLEKEEKKERELKESKLKQRMENEKAKREAISTTTTTTTTTTTDASTPAEVDKPAATTATAATTIGAATTTSSSSSKCNTCGGSFPDAASYRAHFKSEWHRYNLNRKMKSLPIVSSEEAFAKLSFDEINAASISSGHNNG